MAGHVLVFLLSTNGAESSITIDGVIAVIDSGVARDPFAVVGPSNAAGEAH
jgi:hypothetical protein